MSAPVFDIDRAYQSTKTEEPLKKEPSKEPSKEPPKEWERLLDVYSFLCGLHSERTHEDIQQSS